MRAREMRGSAAGGRAALKGAGRGDARSPDIAIPSPTNLLGEPAETGAYRRYVRENLGRSRLLFRLGDLRYAVFSANEGLELCVKAYLLHYRAIVDPSVMGHFPHSLLIKSIRKSAELFGKQNPGEAGLVRQTTAYLDELAALFKKLKNPGARVALWKRSLGADPVGDEQELLDGLGPLATEWSEQYPQARAGPLQGGPGGGRVGFMSADRGALRAPLLALFHQKFELTGGTRTVPLPGSGDVPVAEALYHGRLIALTELFLHTTAIVNGYVHQQMSRYPTQVDGVDSGEVYARHRGGVGRLLVKIHGACGALLPHLDSRQPPPPPPPFPQDVREALAQE